MINYMKNMINYMKNQILGISDQCFKSIAMVSLNILARRNATIGLGFFFIFLTNVTF